ADGTFDGALSLLVLQEFPDPPRAFAEMRRVVRRGGVVAAAQWDFAAMPVIATLVDALSEVAPSVALHLRKPPAFTSESALARAWAKAGYADVAVTRIQVTRRFADFEALWHPLLTGPTPSTMVLAGLRPPERDAARTIMRHRLACREPFEITAAAMAVRGV